MPKFGQIKLGSKRKGGIRELPGFTSISVDRENPVLGNKYVLWDHRDDDERAEVIWKYKEDYDADWAQNGPMKEATLKIARRVYKGENIMLLCWCSGPPIYKPCHAELIKERIEGILAPYMDKQ